MTGMEIIAREGSVIDLSGGSVRYLDGYVQSTLLVTASGARVPIEMAQAGVVYVAVERGYIRQNARWGITEQWTSFFSRSGRRFERIYRRSFRRFVAAEQCRHRDGERRVDFG